MIENQTIPRKDYSVVSDTDWAYTAALMDGEGSFTISKVIGKSTAGNPYNAFDCKVMISNTSEVLMNWIISRFGGAIRLSIKHISKKAKANGQKSQKPCYRWTVEKYENQEDFLKYILPYLVIKKEQAEVALEYVQMLGQINPKHRLELYRKMKALNGTESVTTNTSGASLSDEK